MTEVDDINTFTQYSALSCKSVSPAVEVANLNLRLDDLHHQAVDILTTVCYAGGDLIGSSLREPGHAAGYYSNYLNSNRGDRLAR